MRRGTLGRKPAAASGVEIASSSVMGLASTPGACQQVHASRWWSEPFHGYVIAGRGSGVADDQHDPDGFDMDTMDGFDMDMMEVDSGEWMHAGGWGGE